MRQVPDAHPAPLQPEVQTDGFSCGFHALSAVYRSHGLDPRRARLRERLGTSVPAIPFVKDSTRDFAARSAARSPAGRVQAAGCRPGACAWAPAACRSSRRGLVCPGPPQDRPARCSPLGRILRPLRGRDHRCGLPETRAVCDTSGSIDRGSPVANHPPHPRTPIARFSILRSPRERALGDVHDLLEQRIPPEPVDPAFLHAFPDLAGCPNPGIPFQTPGRPCFPATETRRRLGSPGARCADRTEAQLTRDRLPTSRTSSRDRRRCPGAERSGSISMIAARRLFPVFACDACHTEIRGAQAGARLGIR